MTQALNLANFANKLNSSGQTDNTGLQNSSVTVTAGTGMSGGGSVALGSSVTLTNAGVTSLTSGGGLSLSASTGAITITTSNTGTVTSVATGNGLQGGTITTTGTLSVACPTFNTVGSYCQVVYSPTGGADPTSGSNYAAGAGGGQVRSAAVNGFFVANLSGTWKWMGSSGNACGTVAIAVGCRVA